MWRLWGVETPQVLPAVASLRRGSAHGPYRDLLFLFVQVIFIYLFITTVLLLLLLLLFC